MSIKLTSIATAAVLASLLASPLTGCGAVGAARDVVQGPQVSPIMNPVADPNYRPVAVPMPAPQSNVHQANSLWRQGSTTFFQDQRAGLVGDIVTILIEISDSAAVANTTSRSRTNAQDSDLSAFLGMEGSLGNILPDAVLPSATTSFGSTNSLAGTGTINRQESVTMSVAALITQTLPNGNLVIQAHQEVLVNSELRELYVTGIIRPEDISNDNTVEHTQIAEARISYGGRGDITRMQRAPWGSQIYEAIFPY